mmetsp:Transcript_106076/g.188658  ORF Transcript_106076/g.188658 Transcript_106076/m.188658 type:complete len:329 (-) Transcript_106076:1087-2073(-)
MRPVIHVWLTSASWPKSYSNGRRRSNLCKVEAVISALDVHFCIHWDLRITASLHQISNLASMVLAPIHDMVPEDARNSRVRQDVSIANQDLVIGEWPVTLRAPRVMIIDESDSILWHPSYQTSWLPVSVFQPPVLRVSASLLENAFRSEIEGRRPLTCSIDPVAEVLPMPVLVVAEAVIVILHVSPKLAYSPGRLAFLAVKTHKLCGIAFDKIEAPTIDANLQPKPSQPYGDALLDLLVAMVDIWCRVKLSIRVTWTMLTASIRILVSQCDGPAAPVHDPCKAWPRRHATSELVPFALAVLLVATPVVDDNVSHRAETNAVELPNQSF